MMLSLDCEFLEVRDQICLSPQPSTLGSVKLQKGNVRVKIDSSFSTPDKELSIVLKVFLE